MRFPRSNVVLGVLITFAAISTVIALLQRLLALSGNGYFTIPRGSSLFELVIRAYLDHSYQFATAGYFFVVGALYWRGRVKSAWRRTGFGQDVFKLFLQMKGSKTRMTILQSLSVPKDRFQLAKELGCDWNVAAEGLHGIDVYVNRKIE